MTRKMFALDPSHKYRAYASEVAGRNRSLYQVVGKNNEKQW